MFSKQQDIVDSTLWMNKQLEDGLGDGRPPGFIVSKETCQLLSEVGKGNKNGIGNKNALGYRHTEETLKIIAEASKNRKGKCGPNIHALGFKHPIIRCPHCDKKGAIHLMTRHHFDNCKKFTRFITTEVD